MPRCYLIALCVGSSLDLSTRNLTLFNMFEGLQLPEAEFGEGGATLPVEVHSYWQFEPEEIGVRHEFRYVSRREDVVRESGPIELPAENRRFRMRTRGLSIPSYGYREFSVEWRRYDGETPRAWVREPVFWPLDVNPPPSQESPTEPLPNVKRITASEDPVA